MLYFRAHSFRGWTRCLRLRPEIRADIEAEARAKGWPALHAQLADVDPATAEKLHPNHSQRICRALEVYRGTGTPLSEWQQGQTPSSATGYECIALCPADRSVLHQRIADRLSDMFDAGLIDEVRALRARGDLHTDLPASQGGRLPPGMGAIWRGKPIWRIVVKRCWPPRVNWPSGN